MPGGNPALELSSATACYHLVLDHRAAVDLAERLTAPVRCFLAEPR
jgi:hypothetical protein